MINSDGKKIVFILGGMRRGGAEKVISILSDDYAARGWKTDIIILLFHEVGYELNEKVNIINFSGKIQSRWLRVIPWVYQLRNYIKREKPDVIVSFFARINVITMIAAAGSCKKIVLSERNDPAHDNRGMLTKMMINGLYPRADKIVFQTQRAMSFFDEKIQKKGVVIGNPVRVSTRAATRKSKKIVSVGKLSAQKNHAMLISTFSKIVKQFPEHTLWIYGEGELRNALTELTERLQVADRVHLPGNVPDIHEQIADAELFVLSSDYEGLSNALLEAMLMGLPCISTRCAGSDEVIEDGVDGVLVDVGDQKELERAMVEILSDGARRQGLAEAARKKAERFSADNILGEWRRAIEQ